jgi:hypothetical protein
MIEDLQPHHSHLFTLRLWQEAWGDGQSEWRGQVQHVLSGEARYFREWPALIVYLLEMAAQAEASQGQADGGEDEEAG